MHEVTSILIFMLGAVIGSGLLALAARSQAGESWQRGRSVCPNCGTQLLWWELIPILSFIMLRRRCRTCSESISWQCLLVELAGGGLFLLSYLIFGMTVGAVLSAAVMILLLFMYIYDAQTMLIPNWSVWSFNAAAFAGLFLDLTQPLGSLSLDAFRLPDLWMLAAGPLVALPIFLLWLFSRGRAMGFGDVKLVLGMGWLLGVVDGFTALTFSFWIGAAVSLALLGYSRWQERNSPKKIEEPIMNMPEAEEGSSRSGSQQRLTMKSAVPFGPFLVLGFLLVFFTNIALF